jgi:hypothetical protein
MLAFASRYRGNPTITSVLQPKFELVISRIRLLISYLYTIREPEYLSVQRLATGLLAHGSEFESQ